MARYSYIKQNTTTYMQSTMDQIDTEIQAHGGWTAVDVVNSPGGMPCRVYRNNGTANATGQDWYLYIARTVANPGTLYYCVSEGYDTAGKKAIRPAPGSNYATVPPTTDFSYGGGTGYPLWTGTTGSTLNTTDLVWYAMSSGGYASDVWFVVAQAGLWVWGNAGSRSTTSNFSMMATHVERFNSALPWLYACGDFTNPGGDLMRGTRHPNVTLGQSMNWVYQTPSWSGATWNPWIGQLNGQGDRFWGSRPIGARRCCRTGRSAPSLYGELYGLYPGVWLIDSVNATASNDTVMPGDTCTMPRTDGSGQTDTFAYAWRSGGGVAMWVDITQA